MIIRPTLLFSLIVLASAACSPKPSPEPAIAVPATPAPKEAVAKAPKAKVAAGPELACPAGTQKKQAHIAEGTEYYCANDQGKTGPSLLTNKAGDLLVKRTFDKGASTGTIELFHEGKALATGTFNKGWLAALSYKDAPPVHRGPDFFLVQSELQRAGACKTDSDCTSQLGKCPLGCDLVFNKAHKSKVDAWLTSFKGNCMYRCMPQTGALKCEYEQCIRTHH